MAFFSKRWNVLICTVITCIAIAIGALLLFRTDKNELQLFVITATIHMHDSNRLKIAFHSPKAGYLFVIELKPNRIGIIRNRGSIRFISKDEYVVIDDLMCNRDIVYMLYVLPEDDRIAIDNLLWVSDRNELIVDTINSRIVGYLKNRRTDWYCYSTAACGPLLHGQEP